MILHHYPQNHLQVKAFDWTPLWTTKVGKFVVFMRHLNDYDTIESPYEWCHRPGGHWLFLGCIGHPWLHGVAKSHLRTVLPQMSCWNVLLGLLFTKLPTSVNCTFSIPTALTFLATDLFFYLSGSSGGIAKSTWNSRKRSTKLEVDRMFFFLGGVGRS